MGVGDGAADWLASGVAGLTGRPDGRPLLPAPVTLAGIVDLVANAPVAEPLALLGERAAFAGHSRAGATSCGGATRLVAAGDGWLAVSLARPEDVDAVAAWLELPEVPAAPWSAVLDAAGHRSVRDLVDRATLLGLPVAAMGETQGSQAVRRRPVGARAPLDRPPLVVDLSALWAGPLCSHLLGLGGARVVKVESVARPDGGRAGDRAFFDLINHGKASVALDLPAPDAVARLRALLAAADVVIEGSRPRALRQWGIDASALLAQDDGPQVWVSITGHGREGGLGRRVAFGDDAAVAGGLVVADDDGCCFLADAVADPLTGIAAASAVSSALTEGGAWLLDVALARVAAAVAGADRAGTPIAEPVPPPRARPVPGPARPLGADTAAVLAELT